MIPFQNIPQNIRVPLFYAEIDNSQANGALVPQNALILAQILGSGSGVPNIPVQSQGVGDAANVGGLNSMLHLMVNAYRQNDFSGELWTVPLADPAGAAAVGSINFTSAPTAGGVFSLYIAGVLIQLPISSTMTAAQVATALVALVGTTPLLPVSAAVDGATTTKVDFTALNVGAAGNDIDIRVNYRGAVAGEVTPPGLAYTIVPMASGTLIPALTTALSNLNQKAFDFIICPYTDSTSLAALKAFMNDQVGRWAWSEQIYGHVFIALRGTAGALTTFGLSQNDQHKSCMGFYDSPTPNWLLAAQYSASAAVSLRNDPGLPLQTLTINGFLPPPVQSQFSLQQNNSLLYAGISTFNVADDGTVSIQNIITEYLSNAFGNPDDSYLQIETMFTLMFVLRFLKTRVTSKFGRFKLAANGTRFGPGARVVTPNIIRADQIAAFQELETDFALVQDSDQFAAELIVEQNAQNPNRVDVLWPGTLINQLRIFALLAQFRL